MPTDPIDRFDRPALSGSLDEVLERFEACCRCGERPDLAAFVPSDPAARHQTLAELVHLDLEYRLRDGEPVRVEDYLGRFPELAADAAAVLDLIGTEYALRQVLLGLSVEEYLARFPHLRLELLARLAPPGTASDPHSVGPHPGRVGRYELQRVVGAGATGIVYEAQDTTLNRTVAVKVLHTVETDDGEAVGRFAREARLLARLRHPGIVTLYDAGPIAGRLILASEYLTGGTLADRLAAGPVPARDAARWLAEIADALDHAHRRGIVHRDVKPSNVVFDADCRPKLTDFGLARSPATDPALTASGQVLGTPAYMPPEQAAGRPADTRSDVYGLGTILYEALAGRPPFSGHTPQVMRKVLEDDPVPPSRVRPGVPADLERVCLTAMAKNPAQRYPTTANLADDLRRFLVGRAVIGRPPPWVTRVVRRCRQRPVQTALVFALVLTTLGGVIGIGWQRWQTGARQAEAERIRADREVWRRECRAEFEFTAQTFRQARVSAELCPGFLTPADRRLLEAQLKHYTILLGAWGDAPSREFERGLAYSEGVVLLRLLGRPGEGVEYGRAGVGLWEEQLDQDPDSPILLSGAVTSHMELGELLAGAGRPADAVEEFRRAGELIDRLSEQAPGSATWLATDILAAQRQVELLAALGRGAEAAECERDALDLQTERLLQGAVRNPDDAELMGCTWAAVGNLHRVRGRPTDAADCYRRACEVLAARHRITESPERVQECWTRWQTGLGSVLAYAGDRQGALAAFEAARPVYERLVANHPDVLGYRYELAECLYYVGNQMKKLGRRAEADRVYLASVHVLTVLDEACGGDARVRQLRDKVAGARFRNSG